MLKRFVPDMYQKSIFEIKYDKLKQQGIKCLLFDLDNTVSPAREVVLCKRTKNLFERLKRDFEIILFSNNFPKRIKQFANFYEVDCACVSLKPLSYKYRYILRKYGYQKNEVAAIGDQLLTDVQGGNKMGLKTILVDPISSVDEKETWLNREIEKLILERFEKNNTLVKGRYYD